MVRIEIVLAPFNASGGGTAEDDPNAAGGGGDANQAGLGGTAASSPIDYAYFRPTAAGLFYTWNTNMTLSDLTTFNVNRYV